MSKYFDALERRYSPDQPRDDAGRWTSGGGGGRAQVAQAQAIPAVVGAGAAAYGVWNGVRNWMNEKPGSGKPPASGASSNAPPKETSTGEGGDSNKPREPGGPESTDPPPPAKPGNLTGRRSTSRINDDAETIRGRARENDSADTLVSKGHNVEQNPKTFGPKDPDFRIDGEIFDNYAPNTNSARNTNGHDT